MSRVARDPRTIPVHFSALKMIGRSPAHYLHSVREGHKDKPAFRTGRLIHKLVLGFDDFAVFDGTRRGKVWDAFRADNDGREIFTQSEYDQCAPVAEAVLAHPLASELLYGDKERYLRWSMCGRECAGTPDIASTDHLLDLKTSRESDPYRFAREAIRYGYHAQLSWYREARHACGLGRPQNVYIWSVEKDPPYVSTVHRLTDRALDMGERQWRIWWERLMVCEQSDNWPGYTQTIVDFDVPDDDFGGTIDFETEELVA